MEVLIVCCLGEMEIELNCLIMSLKDPKSFCVYYALTLLVADLLTC